MLPEKQTNVNKSIDGFIKMNAAFVKVHQTWNIIELVIEIPKIVSPEKKNKLILK